MHIVITDSGVGGLSVCAYAERFVRTHGFTEPVQLTFANAAPENDYGYNSMPSREVKIETFNRFLRNVTARFAPDFIYVACNTLSVLLPDTPFMATGVPVKGIVETAVELLLAQLAADPRSVAMIFATQTTIDAGAYPRLLEERGIAPSRIVTQACPELADTISEDREGTKTREEIRGWVAKAVAKMATKDAPVVAALACTHYGYRKDVFAAALAEAGVDAQVINPNESAVGDLFPAGSHGEHREADVQFVTRYAIPQATIVALTWFLSDISPRTVDAMQHFVHLPDLF
ncbi:MAG TPA: aspartate/glutamate racemase family protein [Thermoanaerobaculia bacterium]|nr:aspartate/glutamate racemase family protein [Thermoanaerobaculia bacterium]